MDNFNKELAQNIAAHPKFQAAYETLQKESLAALMHRVPSFEKAEVRKILRSALIFAQAKDIEFSVLAQDIVYALASLRLMADDEVLVCQHIMALLGNFPASSFLKAKEESHYSLPWQLQLVEEVRRDGNLVRVSGKEILLTDFQADVWQELLKHQFLSVAAPTSAGKSFLIQTYLKDVIDRTKRPIDIAYIVPSRSLIHEVQASLSSAFLNSVDAPIISSVPRKPERAQDSQARIFVFTQERFRTAINEDGLTPQLLVVDEAQQISDGSRGMLLLSCLEEIHTRSPHSKIIFITPGSRSGGPIGSLMGLGELPTIKTNLRPVRQNLIFVNFLFAQRKKQLGLSLYRNNLAPLSLGTTDLCKAPTTTARERFLAAISTLGHEGQNLVYAAGKDEAEKLAVKIASVIASATEPSSKLRELASFVRHHVHPEYSLAYCLEKGIAFHYGSMPTNLTKTIEEYFSSGELKYLVCTSTLLQGVNLPARSIFIHNPRKGKGVPMGPEDFWNLAGRAGRLSKDTHGNIFLINYGKWDRKPIEEARESDVVPSLTKAFTTHHDDVVRYIRDERHLSGQKKTNFVESVFTRLFIDAQEGALEQTIERATHGKEISGTDDIQGAVELYLNVVSLPSEVLKKNASISALRQQYMYDFLLSSIRAGELKKLVPLHPLQPGEVKERLEYIMLLSHSYLEGKPSNAGKYFGWFSLSWMRGTSLRDMIDFQLKNAREKANVSGHEAPSAGVTIIKVLDEVEKKLRFHYVRYLSCYIDLLKHAVNEVHPGREFEVPPIPLFLELGACASTMIACMEIGMSRIAAKEVMTLLKRNDLDVASVKAQLKNVKFSTSNISPIILREISKLGVALS